MQLCEALICMNEFRDQTAANLLDTVRLTQYLAEHGKTLTSGPQFQQFSGGYGNWNYLVEVDGVPMVLRRPPEGQIPQGANDMAREHTILSRLNRVFPLAPVSPLYCSEPSVIGAPFILIEYRRGVVVRANLPPAFAQTPTARYELAHTAIDALTLLHAVDPDEAGLDCLGKPEGMLARQARNWTTRAQVAYGGQLPREVEKVIRYLDGPTPVAQRVSLLHSDYKLDNLIFDQATQKPVALIDWDMGTRGDPLFDLATLLSYWTEPDDHPAMHQLQQMPTALDGFPSRTQVMRLYADKTGLDMSNFKYYRVLALYKLVVVFRQLYSKYERREVLSEPFQRFGQLSDGLLDYTQSVIAHDH